MASKASEAVPEHPSKASEKVPEHPSKIYRTTIDIIIGVLITQSFVNVSGEFVPIANLLNWQQFVNALGIMLVYFIIISGWIGYHRSVTHRPHLGRSGSFRYLLDLMVLFLIYYSTIIADPKKSAYGELFLWVIPALFILYSTWDILKFREYRNNEDDKLKVNPKSLNLSFRFGLVALGLAFAYNYLGPVLINVNPITVWDNKNILDTAFIVIYFVFTFLYRYFKRKKEVTTIVL